MLTSTCTVQEQAAMGSNWNNIQMMLGGRAADLFVEMVIDQVVTNPDGNQAINYLAISYLSTDRVTQLAKYKLCDGSCVVWRCSERARALWVNSS
ncbi:unnamed protein product [Medioppia subpectinata]|uniref:Uncharacterized protein n=1 Tax=Medioppia subpectinata TaxID=1979941 RepID=A0A7R9L274_9ACAR|nr:unnamed protein product [Medioppia subpectinata]CAG2113912.1 unnamed protein product [Medioppia subpectinata]